MKNDDLFSGFDDGKDPAALRTIGEVAKALGIRQHVLRYWEEQFPMLRPVKRGGGRRYYRPDDVQLLLTIDRLVQREGYTLRGARLALEGKEVGSAGGQSSAVPAPTAFSSPPPSEVPTAERHDVTAELRKMRAALAAALAES